METFVLKNSFHCIWQINKISHSYVDYYLFSLQNIFIVENNSNCCNNIIFSNVAFAYLFYISLIKLSENSANSRHMCYNRISEIRCWTIMSSATLPLALCQCSALYFYLNTSISSFMFQITSYFIRRK